jgi:hypothetical protein
VLNGSCIRDGRVSTVVAGHEREREFFPQKA